MNRRSLLKTVGGAVLALPASGLLIPRRAWAPPPPPPPVAGVWATKFNGMSYIRRDDLSDFPTSTPYGALLYRFRSTATTTPNQTILWCGTQAGYGSLTIMHLVTAPRRGTPTAQLYSVFVKNPGGGLPNPNANFSSPLGALRNDGNYHLVAGSWDLTVPKMTLMIDGVQVTNPVGSGSSALPNGNPYHTGAGGAPIFATVGNLIGSPNCYYTGELAELMLFLTSSPVDITDPNVMAAFTDPNTGLPVRHSSMGTIPIGPWTGNGLVPASFMQAQVYLGGPPAVFGENLAGRVSNPTNTWINIPDTTPSSSFYTAAGALQSASIDPWGFTGV